MTIASKRGGGVQQDKKRPSRLAPEGSQKKSNSCDPVHSAPAAQNQEQPRATRFPPPNILMPARIRRQQISRLLLYRHNGPCRTDEAAAWFEEIAIHLVISCTAKGLELVALEWAQRHTPGLPRASILEILAMVQAVRPFFTSEDIGRRRQLTYEEKVTLCITHIAAFDISPAELAARKSASECERVNTYRWKTGKVRTPRSMSIARRVPRLEGEGNDAFYKRAKGLVAAGLA